MFFWRLNHYLSVAVAAVSFFLLDLSPAVRILASAGIMVAFNLSFAVLVFAFLGAVSLTVPMKKEYDRPSPFYYSIFQLAYGYLLRTGGARIHVTGLEKVPSGVPFLFVSNHISKFDNMVESISLKGHTVAFITKPENYSIPIGRHFMKRSCYLPIDRGNPRNGLMTIIKASEMLRDRICSIGVFPEGTRGTGERLQELKPGCLKIACKSKSPIVIGTIRGTEKIHKNFPFKRTDVYFDIVDVIPGETAGEMKTVELADRITALMKASLKEGE